MKLHILLLFVVCNFFGSQYEINTLKVIHNFMVAWPPCEYPLNLSILLNGGRETNWDIHSIGE